MLYQLSYSGAQAMVGQIWLVSLSHGPSEAVAKLGDMEHPKAVGDRSMLAVMLALREAGFAIYLPFGENTRVDMIIDDGARVARVQCKTGRLRDGAVRFKTCSDYAHHTRILGPPVGTTRVRSTISRSTAVRREASTSYRSSMSR
jgi:PD-(D/E)XK endonuclease